MCVVLRVVGIEARVDSDLRGVACELVCVCLFANVHVRA